MLPIGSALKTIPMSIPFIQSSLASFENHTKKLELTAFIRNHPLYNKLTERLFIEFFGEKGKMGFLNKREEDMDGV